MPPLNTPVREPEAAFWYTAFAPIAGSVLILLLGAIVFTAAQSSCQGESCGGSFSLAIIAPLFVLMVIVVIGYPLVYYLLFSYVLTERTITVNSGILFRVYMTLEFGRIQVIDLDRGPLLWIFGLTELQIWTASADQLTFNLNEHETSAHPRPDTTLLLTADEAQKVKDFIMQNKSSTSAV